MRWLICCLTLIVLSIVPPALAAAPATGVDLIALPTLAPTTQPGESISVPYKLTDTNHILIRVKVNGKGPFNFIMDTGAPAMFLRVTAAEKLGLKSNNGGLTTLDKLEVEGGVELKHVQCVVETPYQIEGMNAIGATGVDLDGLLGYAILARFRLQIDLSKDHMLWTPINYSPPPLSTGRGPRPKVTASDATDRSEANLESMGSVMKLLGPLIKPKVYPSKYRGMVGLELAVSDEKAGDKSVLTISVARVLGGSPAEKAGIEVGDIIQTINNKPVHSIAAAQSAMDKSFVGQVVNFVIARQEAVIKLNITCAEGL